MSSKLGYFLIPSLPNHELGITRGKTPPTLRLRGKDACLRYVLLLEQGVEAQILDSLTNSGKCWFILPELEYSKRFFHQGSTDKVGASADETREPPTRVLTSCYRWWHRSVRRHRWRLRLHWDRGPVELFVRRGPSIWTALHTPTCTASCTGLCSWRPTAKIITNVS